MSSAENFLKPLYGVPSAFAAHAAAGVGEKAVSAWPASLSALCSTLAGGRESMGRDAPRPDAARRLRGAAEGKGAAAWRRDRSHAQHLASGASMASTGRTHPSPAASTVAPLARTYAREDSLRIQVFGAFLSGNFSMLSCGYPTFGAYIPTFGAYKQRLSRLLGRVPTWIDKVGSALDDPIWFTLPNLVLP